MIAIGIRFPAGRFHATPWGRHVNEAAPEWPPSPWRLLRALVATWKRKLDGNPRCPPQIIESMLHSIADPPMFALPPSSLGHSRHYMPWYKKGPEDKTMVFDAFVVLDKKSELTCLWPEVRLNEEEYLALAVLVENLGFLGRAESWVEARVFSEAEADNAITRINCVPLNGGIKNVKNHETVRVLCPDPTSAFGNQHTPRKETIEGRGKEKQIITTPLYDPDWHLCMETLELHSKRWSDPPGSQWLTYMRPRDCFAPFRGQKKRPVQRPKPTIARFILDGPVLPLAEDTLRIGETARRVAMGCYRRIIENKLHREDTSAIDVLPRSEAFSGKNKAGEPLAGHEHAFFIPSDEDGDGRLDHLTIIANMGFNKDEIRALNIRMRRLPQDQADPLDLMLIALGQQDAIAANKLFGPAKVWKSATPFLVTRHAKSRGRKKDPPELLRMENQRAFARYVLCEEIERLRIRRPEIPAPISVEPLNETHCCGAHHLRPIQFKRFRRKHGDDGGRRASGAFRIIFPAPVHGPICIGHSSHFGLGLFVPE